MFEHRNEQDKPFARHPDAIRAWFCNKTKYYDDRYFLNAGGKRKL
jgi:hypothetical protein